MRRQKDLYLDLDARWHHDGPEAERVRTDGGDDDGGHVGMHHGAAGRRSVRRAAGRGRDDQT